MAFCIFSKDIDNSYTIVENKFITKYLPEADGFAVKVYLYGLYLCKNTESDFSLRSMAEVLKTTEEKIIDAFEFWEDYDLVEILSREPFTVQYLPVKAAVGKGALKPFELCHVLSLAVSHIFFMSKASSAIVPSDSQIIRGATPSRTMASAKGSKSGP